MSRLNASLIDKREEAAIVADLMVQSELERQQADLAELQVAAADPADFDSVVMRLRSRAKANAEALFSRDMTR
jgi:hypothetical protein